MIRQRTQARELALQAIYQINAQKLKDNINIDELIANPTEMLDEEIPQTDKVDPKVTEYAYHIVSGYLENRAEIDEVIKKAAKNWRFERIALVDKAILQMAVFELLYMDGIPKPVSINEAIEIAKKYSGKNSPAFINGVLDSITVYIKKKKP